MSVEARCLLEGGCTSQNSFVGSQLLGGLEARGCLLHNNIVVDDHRCLLYCDNTRRRQGGARSSRTSAARGRGKPCPSRRQLPLALERGLLGNL